MPEHCRLPIPGQPRPLIRLADEDHAALPEPHEAGPFVYAVTGLAAAWLHTRFAGFRLVSLYMDPTPGLDLEKELGFEKADRGANLWIIRPKDDGVYQGQTRVDRTPVVHPVQAYMDLKDHPERASEAAENLRERFLSWARNA